MTTASNHNNNNLTNPQPAAASTRPFSDQITRFYADPSTRSSESGGRSLHEILAFSDAALERQHDYIQILFPLPERSPINPSAPLLTEGTRAAFRADPALRGNLLRAFTRMAGFYGFEVVRERTSSGVAGERPGERDVVVRLATTAAFHPRARATWLVRFDHNHLRISRIIRCLRILALPDAAQAFFTALHAHAGTTVSARSLMFWDRAARRPLYLAPDDNDDDEGGVAWLWGG